jgi:hypothetical protein
MSQQSELSTIVSFKLGHALTKWIPLLFASVRVFYVQLIFTNKTDRHDITKILMKVALKHSNPENKYYNRK